jgi:hypothetical protein
MTFSRKQIDERKMIADHPKRRPYASRIKFQLQRGGFEFPKSCTILAANGSLIDLQVVQGDGSHQARTVSVTVRGFSSASIAENQGLKLSAAILWAAVSRRVPLRLNYHTPFPSIVFDRTQQSGGGNSLSADGYGCYSFSGFIDKLRDIFDSNSDVDPRLLISMELFTSARLEATERTRFLGLVSSLEPMSTQEPYGEEVTILVEQYLSMLKKSSISEDVRNSLRGSIQRLKNESVGFAIKKLIRNSFPGDNEAIALVSNAYDVRSKILHNGQVDNDLDLITNNLEGLVRRLIAYRLNQTLI